jgi:ribosomal protein S18 acetylase RimI-like enzyme
MTIRQARLADVETVAPLFDGYRQFYGKPSDPAAAADFLRDRLSRQESFVFVAEIDGQAVGFMQLYPVFSSVSLARKFILNDLFVAGCARGRGIARQLLAKAAEFAKGEGAASLALATALDNHAAQSLYEAAGWKRDQAFHHYGLTL